MLINLSDHLPFNIDEDILQKLAFSGTLLISYVPSRAPETVVRKTKEKNSAEEEVPVCGCVACRCNILPNHHSNLTDHYMNAPSTSAGKQTFQSDSFSSFVSESYFTLSEKSIEFNDSFFQETNSDPSSLENSCTVEKLVAECFRTPLISLEDTIPTGARSIAIQRHGLLNDKLSVYVISRFYQDGYEIGLTLSSNVDSRLHTIDEKVTEHMKKTEKEFVEREASLFLSSDGYKCEFSYRKEEEKTISIKNLGQDQIQDLLLDGAFIVLVRYIAITKFEGRFTVNTININGEVCETEIISKIYQNEMVNKVRIPVMKVAKKKTCPSGHVKVKGYIITLAGQMLQMYSSSSKFVIHINPLQPVDRITKTITPMSTLRSNWMDNMNMFFLYINPDYEPFTDIEELTHKAQLHLLLTEYIKMILMMRPLDVIPFTTSYFFNIFTGDNIPHNPYFDKTFRRVRYSSDIP